MLIVRRSAGFTLVELLIAMAVFAIMLVLGVPAFGTWIHNTQIRSTAEALQNGLRVAQAEAMNRNRMVAFVLTTASPAFGATPSTNGYNWYAQVLPIVSSEASETSYTSSAYIQGGALGASSNGTTITAGISAICFNSLGHLAAYTGSVGGASYSCTVPTANNNSVIFAINNANGNRPLDVTVNFGGQIRLCDPNLSLASNPAGCN